MLVTCVGVVLAPESQSNTLKAYTSITLSDGVHRIRVDDIKIIRAKSGTTFLSMPARVKAAKCRCGESNKVIARFCNACGKPLKLPLEHDRIHHDYVYPVDQETRTAIHQTVMEAYEKALRESVLPKAPSPQDSPRPA